MPGRIHPLAQYMMALAIMIGAYSAYVKFAVPLIEGPMDQVRRSVPTVPTTLSEKQDNKARLFKLLPTSAWELGQCKTLFTNSGTLLFQEMKRIDDKGNYTLTPFTMILNDHESGTAFAAQLDPTVPPTVLRCGQAKLKFDGPLSMTGNSNTQMRSAVLNGEVSIFRPSPSDEKDETLKLLTRNVQIDTDRILTFSEVAFSFGPHKGSGKNLVIDLTHQASASGKVIKDFSSIEGVSRIELAKLDRLVLDPQSLSSPTPSATPPTAKSKKPNLLNAAKAPLEIVCKGPFVFDYDKRTATFFEKVYGKQLDEFGDNLSCETLTVAFAQSPQPSSPQPAVSPNSSAGMNIKYLSAIGTTDQPAVIIANSRQTKITGDELLFDSQGNQITANSTDMVTIVGPEINIRSRTLRYELTDDQSLGNLQATGPGEFFRRSDNPQGNIFARWQKGLTIKDRNDNPGNQKLIVIDGEAEILVQEETQIVSDRINIALHQLKVKDQFEYRPAEIFADQRVTILSPNLDGVAGKLVARWPKPDLKSELSLKQSSFNQSPLNRSLSNQAQQRLTSGQRSYRVMRPQITGGVANQPVSSGASTPSPSAPQTQLQSLSSNTGRANFAPLQLATYEGTDVASAVDIGTDVPQNKNSASGKKRVSLKQFIRFKTDAVELELAQDGDTLQLADLKMDGNIVIHQLPEKGSTKPPLKVAGDSVRVVPQGNQIFRLLVGGSREALATVISEGLSLSGEDIHLDQQANKVWVAGSGVMNIKQGTSNTGATKPQSGTNPAGDLAPDGDIDVEFSGGMVFDGSKIYFERNVMMTSHGNPADTERSVTKTLSQALSVELAQRVDFSQLSSGEKIGDVKMSEMVLVNHITADQRVFKDHAGNDDPRMNATDTPIIFQNETFDSKGKLAQQRRVVVPRATINAATNTVYAVGPGKIFTHQRGTKGLAGIGGLDKLGSAPEAQNNQRRQNGAAELNYLQVNFDGRLVADLGQKQLNIAGNIRTLFSPATSFDFLLDPDSGKTLPEGALKMRCENMQLSQWLPTGADKPQNEIIATGNTHVISPTFESTSDRISFNDGNDQLVVEGTPRSPANLWHRQTPRGQRQHLTAAKIVYHPSTGTAETQGVRNLNVSIGK